MRMEGYAYLYQVTVKKNLAEENTCLHILKKPCRKILRSEESVVINANLYREVSSLKSLWKKLRHRK